MASTRDRRTVIAPEPGDLFRDAVVRAGGELVDDPAEASVLVWTGFGPADFDRQYLHEGIGLVQLGQSGIDRWIDSGLVDDSRVWTSAAGAFGELVGERAVALLLAGIHRLGEHAHSREWTRHFGGQLRGSRVLVAGTGAIGQYVGQCVRALGATAVGMNRSGQPVDGFDEMCAFDTWPEVCGHVDHVVLAVPLTDQTRDMIAADSLAHLGPDAVIVNVGRGASVDSDAVLEALEAGRLGAAMLDVTWPEPLPEGHGLWDHPRAVITSHTGNPRAERERMLAAHVEENLRRWYAGDDPVTVIDLDRGY